MKTICLFLAAGLMLCGCGYRFSGGQGDSPFPTELKTIQVESSVNNTIVTGIETELTNDLRKEFALGTRLKLASSKGDMVLKTVIASYGDTPSTYRADGKELTRIGTLKVACRLEQADNGRMLWNKTLAASYSYNVTDSIQGTLDNKRRAISAMIKDLIPRIHRSMYDDF